MATQSRSSADASVTEALAHAFAAFGPAYKRWAQAHLSEQRMGFTHSRALHVLQCKGPLMMSGLGDDLGITPRYVTVLIDDLEQRGLVARRRHPSDRRVTLVELTDAGRRTCELAGDEHVAAAAELLRALPHEQQHALLEALRSLLAELQRHGFAGDPAAVVEAPLEDCGQ